MKIKSAEFVKSAAKPSHYPPAILPEIAFAGRSNVGKSSLINTLLNRKRLVKTSSTPGRTQLINFFDINKTFSFVDLPGYGYAKVPAKIQKTWAPMIEGFLAKRESLKGVVLIMDIRRTPGQGDTTLINWLDYHGIEKILVLTKSDKLKRSKLAQHHDRAAETLCVDKTSLIRFSAKSRAGKAHVWEAIERLLPRVPKMR